MPPPRQWTPRPSKAFRPGWPVWAAPARIATPPSGCNTPPIDPLGRGIPWPNALYQRPFWMTADRAGRGVPSWHCPLSGRPHRAGRRATGPLGPPVRKGPGSTCPPQGRCFAPAGAAAALCRRVLNRSCGPWVAVSGTIRWIVFSRSGEWRYPLAPNHRSGQFEEPRLAAKAIRREPRSQPPHHLVAKQGCGPLV